MYIFAEIIIIIVMKTIKIALCVVIIVLIPVLLVKISAPNNLVFKIIIGVGILLFVVNMTLRKSLRFKNYFKSKFNLFTNKYYYRQVTDVSKELMFEKLKEVINDSKFKLVDSNDERMELLAVSNISMRSWGENIYVSLTSKEKVTIITFCSVAVFQVCSWDKNENNVQELANKLEESFII